MVAARGLNRQALGRAIGHHPSCSFERSQLDIQIDDPGDAQRASKSDAEGDGEEELR